MTREEAMANYRAFTALLEAEPEVARVGEVAVICDQEVIAFYPDVGTAYDAGLSTYGAGRFTIQEVRDTPLYFGAIPIMHSVS
ncbi:hypothetical protein [Candidatus Poriferisodalis sp.]|uniref:hypothetical protein n=1 Tax=Candidatus Poriferisodalis sp. TaxID=3101277 RepID=UPI003B025D2D